MGSPAMVASFDISQEILYATGAILLGIALFGMGQDKKHHFL
jgi:hypothetical protein